MPIEFYCSGCQKALRVPDEAAGKRAKCPQCSAVVVVPASSAPFPSINTAAPNIPVPPAVPMAIPVAAPLPPTGNPFLSTAAPPQISVNPYSAPTGNLGVSINTQTASGLRPIMRTKASFNSIWNPAFELWQRHLGAMAVSMLALMGIGIVAYFGFAIIVGIISVLGLDPEKTPVPFAIFAGCFGLAFGTFAIWLQIGHQKYFLRIARGGTPDLMDLFRGTPHILAIIGLGLIFWLVTMGVYIAFVLVPGLVLSAIPAESRPDLGLTGLLIIGGTWILAFYFVLCWVTLGCSLGFHLIVDRNLGPIQAVQQSWRCMAGNRWVYFFILFVGMLCYMLGVMLCGVGALFSMPLLLMLTTVGYLRITGQIVGVERD